MKQLKNVLKSINKYNAVLVFLILFICTILSYFQIQKIGFHEDEVYTIVSSVNEENGLMSAYKNNGFPENEAPEWKSKESVKNFVTLTPNNYTNFISIFTNQAKDNHPPLFYIFVHISAIIFSGYFTKYTVFLVNIISFVASFIVIIKIFELLNKKHLVIPAIIFYGLSMGTISMVIYQRMYMLLTFFILLYFYYNLKIYKNGMNKTIILKLGTATVLGFLTQYFFAMYAIGIFIVMIYEMLKEKDFKTIKTYIISHIVYATIAILLFPVSIHHLLFTDRGISNLTNNNFLENLLKYINYISYSFSINNFTLTIFTLFVIVFAILAYIHKEKEDKFLANITIIPTVVFLLITVKLTSFQELRYIMPMIPFIVIISFLIYDKLINIKYKNIILMILTIALITNGFVFSGPMFLYKEYKEYLQIAQNHKEKSFVYVYDNFFNHMQSVPEMMIYQKTLLINTSKDEIKYLLNNELNKEDSYILCIKAYMDNDKIIKQIKENTEFKNISNIRVNNYIQDSKDIQNNIYLVSK